MVILPQDDEERCIALSEWQARERTPEDEKNAALVELHNLNWKEVFGVMEDDGE